MNSCDFCKNKTLKKVYTVPESERGMVVYVCKTCSLVQSVQTKKDKEKKAVRISSGANWGNIRIGKSISFARNQKVIEKEIPWATVKNILDIGASRGDFVLWASQKNPKAHIVAIEPDKTVIDTYKKKKPIETITKKYEDVFISGSSFDLIYTSHTLEHVKSARQCLEYIYTALKPGGLVVIDVPNIDVIGDADVVEEFFIDKHTFHFSRSVLVAMLEYVGFDVGYSSDATDRLNIFFILKKSKSAKVANKNCAPSSVSYSNAPSTISLRESEAVQNFVRSPRIIQAQKRISQYQKILKNNRKKLINVGEMLNEFMGRQRVVYWGGGRIYDALVRYGTLDTSRASGLIDTFLAGKVEDLHGLVPKNPQALRLLNPDVVVILAKSSVSEIEKQVRSFGVVNIIKFADLLTNAS